MTQFILELFIKRLVSHRLIEKKLVNDMRIYAMNIELKEYMREILVV